MTDIFTAQTCVYSCNLCVCVCVCVFVCVSAGSVSVFGVGIGIRYFRQYFFHVGSVFGIGIFEILVENRKFLVYPSQSM